MRKAAAPRRVGKTAGDPLLDLGHAHRLFGEVIGEGHVGAPGGTAAHRPGSDAVAAIRLVG